MDFTIFFQCERWFENLRFENSRIGYIQVGQIWGSFEHSDLEIPLLAFALSPARPQIASSRLHSSQTYIRNTFFISVVQVGNGKMSNTEYITHFSLWCLMKAPLLIGCDIRDISADTLTILTNTDAIAVNQDPLGAQGHKLRSDGDLEVWAGPLIHGSMAAILLNRGSTTALMSITSEDLGWEVRAEFIVYDIWQHKIVGEYTGKYSTAVAAHGVMFGTFTKQEEITDNSIAF